MSANDPAEINRDSRGRREKERERERAGSGRARKGDRLRLPAFLVKLLRLDGYPLLD